MVVGLYQPLADDDRGTPSSDQTCLLQSLQKTKKNALRFSLASRPRESKRGKGRRPKPPACYL